MPYKLEYKRRGDGFYIQGQAGEALTAKRLVYKNADGSWYQADADLAASMPSLGITMESARIGTAVSILTYGVIGSALWTWTIGGKIYASATAGALSQVAPVNAIRQSLGYAISATMIKFDPEPVENVIYWDVDNRRTYSTTNGGNAEEVLSGGEWWIVDKSLGETYEDNFNGVFDITGLGIACVISNYPYYATKVGAGTYTSNAGASSGMRITTGALINNSNLIATGDPTGPVLTWNPLQTLWMHLHYRFPNAADANNSYFLGCFYQDANNYVGIRYDTAVDNNLRLVTRAAAAETLTVVGALDTNWHEVYVKFTAGEVRFCQDGTVVVHTTNVPVGNFTWYTYLETLAAAAKNYDISHLGLVQDIGI